MFVWTFIWNTLMRSARVSITDITVNTIEQGCNLSETLGVSVWMFSNTGYQHMNINIWGMRSLSNQTINIIQLGHEMCEQSTYEHHKGSKRGLSNQHLTRTVQQPPCVADHTHETRELMDMSHMQ